MVHAPPPSAQAVQQGALQVPVGCSGCRRRVALALGVDLAFLGGLDQA